MPKRKFIRPLYEVAAIKLLPNSMYTGWYGSHIKRYRVKYYPNLNFYEIYDKNDMVVKTGQGMIKDLLFREAKMYLQYLLNDETQTPEKKKENK